MNVPIVADVKKIETGDSALSVEFSDGADGYYDYFWLRDHATDADSYDSRSHQRELFTAEVDSKAHIGGDWRSHLVPRAGTLSI